MKVVFTGEALRDLDGILQYMSEHYPQSTQRFEERLRAATQRIAAWPSSAPRVHDYSDIRALPLTPFPYRLFYSLTSNSVEILHIRHSARREPWAKR